MDKKVKCGDFSNTLLEFGETHLSQPETRGIIPQNTLKFKRRKGSRQFLPTFEKGGFLGAEIVNVFKYVRIKV